MQGPYLYKLYHSYGLSLVQIGILFLTGFVSGASAGTAVGSLADTWGRKRLCIGYCFIVSTSLLLRLINNYTVLLCSHVLSGIATDLLFTIFEAWYVSEHAKKEFPPEWRSRTFSLATTANSIVAIITGVVSNVLVQYTNFKGPVIASMLLVCVALLTIINSWSENYGDSNSNTSGDSSLLRGLRALFQSRNILIVGVAQTLFECSMYIFVILYVPTLEDVYASSGSLEDQLPLGYLFSTLMIAIMIGSLLYRTFKSRLKIGHRLFLKLTDNQVLVLSLFMASSAFISMAYYGKHSIILLVVCYHVFEMSTGLYFPSMSSIKAEVIPEETRAAVMTLLRIPTNLGVGIIIWNMNYLDAFSLFSICGIMTFIGSLLMIVFYKHQI